MTGFAITQGKGFHLTFPNGITLSTQIGGGNYGENYDYPIAPFPYTVEGHLKNIMELPSSATCEIMIWDTKTIVDMPTFDGKTRKGKKRITEELPEKIFGHKITDSVAGYVSFEQWLEVVDFCRNYKRGEK